MIHEPGFCYCSCHDDRHGVRSMHCVPCCDGKCHRCRKYVARGRMKAHQAEHEASIKKLMDDPHKTEE